MTIHWPQWLASSEFAFNFGYVCGVIATLFALKLYHIIKRPTTESEAGK